nr:MAG TPA: hypothetical protein [Caudoviricetes sp.]
MSEKGVFIQAKPLFSLSSFISNLTFRLPKSDFSFT